MQLGGTSHAPMRYVPIPEQVPPIRKKHSKKLERQSQSSACCQRTCPERTRSGTHKSLEGVRLRLGLYMDVVAPERGHPGMERARWQSPLCLTVTAVPVIHALFWSRNHETGVITHMAFDSAWLEPNLFSTSTISPSICGSGVSRTCTKGT